MHLCFHLGKTPVFSRRGSYKSSEHICMVTRQIFCEKNMFQVFQDFTNKSLSFNCYDWFCLFVLRLKSSQSTIFQSCRDRAKLTLPQYNQYCRELMCLAQGHNTKTPVGIEPRTSRFGVRCSTITPPRSLKCNNGAQTCKLLILQCT